MDNQDEPPLCPFGTPLEPLEEDDVPLKKRIAIEDQVVTDENGRRRFHGAFTGGFSAGFWNTVGSLEGWKPQSFKSSRSEKAEKRGLQIPTDFMDDEDLGEFGIAPQRVQAKEDFSINDESSNRKRTLARNSGGAIPGVAVLQQILEASREKVAVRLLRRMGWKPGQGVGRRQTKKEKKQISKKSKKNVKIYGCALKPDDELSHNLSDESSDISDNDDLDFAPDDFEPLLCVIKDNTFGLGYSGLNRQSTSIGNSHINLFAPLEIMGKGNKKLSIRGQAFGVGALEEEDEDIYARDDMSIYDFSLSDRKDKRKEKNTIGAQDQTILEGFSESHNNLNAHKIVHQIDLKPNFQPRNWLLKKSRFEPLKDKGILALKQNDNYKNHGLGRHDLNPSERGKLLKDNVETKGEKETTVQTKSYLEQISQKYKERELKSKTMLDVLSSKVDNFVKGGLITNSGIEIIQLNELKTNTETHKISEKKKTENFTVGSFKPFANDEAKQERYEKFLKANMKDEVQIKDFLSTIQPINLSEWDREREHKEFVQARNIYKPLNGLMSERFVSKSIPSKTQEQSVKETNEKQKIIVIRTKISWRPHNVICKRFNIPEPFGDIVIECPNKKRNKFSVFDYIEHSVNTKEDFVTPVIIPKHIEKSKEIQSHQMTIDNTKNELSFNASNKEIAPLEALTPLQPHISQTLASNKITNTNKTKTALETKIQESRNKHPSEKKDLFKCIFESSSEDEQQEDDKQAAKNQEVTSENTMSAEIVKTLIKPSVPVNILRNNSPPRGIFAALFTKSVLKTENKEIGKGELQSKTTLKPENQFTIQNTSFVEPNEVYGPKVAENFATEKSAINKDKDTDKRLAELLSKKEIKGTTAIEKWIEKSTKSAKHTKKKKKEKRKHDRKKKHKSKHKMSKKHK